MISRECTRYRSGATYFPCDLLIRFIPNIFVTFNFIQVEREVTKGNSSDYLLWSPTWLTVPVEKTITVEELFRPKESEIEERTTGNEVDV